eukprot:237625-Hanusia_phi.AAC.4
MLQVNSGKGKIPVADYRLATQIPHPEQENCPPVLASRPLLAADVCAASSSWAGAGRARSQLEGRRGG